MGKNFFELQRFAGVSPQEVIKKFMGSLDQTNNSDIVASLNEAVRVASGGYFTTFQQAIDKMVSDCGEIGNANEFLLNKCGINLYNEDTGAITGSDAGGSITKTAESIVPEQGSLEDNYLNNPFDTLIVNGLTISLSKFDSNGNGYGIPYSELNSDAEKFIWHAMNQWWAGGALNLIAESYGDNFSFNDNSSATVKKLSFGLVNNGDNGVPASTVNASVDDGSTVGLSLWLNMNYSSDIDFSNPNGSSSDGSKKYLDRSLAHEFTHAVMAANINHYSHLPAFIAEGMAELTVGIDDYEDKRENMLNFAANPNSLSSALNLNSPDGDQYSAGYMFLRYLAKQGSEHYGESTETVTGETINNTTANVTVQGTSGGDTIHNSGANVQVYSGAGTDIVRNSGANAHIDSGNDSDMIHNSGANAQIHGGEGSDIVHNSGANAYIDGGNGNDTMYSSGKNATFVYTSGNDTISNYSSWDKVNFAAECTGWFTQDNAVYLNSARGTLKIDNARDKMLEVADGGGNILAHVMMLSGGGIFDGRSFGEFVVAVGSDNFANQLFAGQAGSSMWGGRGSSDDELYGNLGIDEYVYSYGNGHDNIFQSGNEDTLNLMNVRLEQISGAALTDNGSYLQFTDGGSLNISGRVGTFIVSGQSYGADYQSKTWYAK